MNRLIRGTCAIVGEDPGQERANPTLIWGRTKTIGRGGDCRDFLLKYKE